MTNYKTWLLLLMLFVASFAISVWESFDEDSIYTRVKSFMLILIACLGVYLILWRFVFVSKLPVGIGTKIVFTLIFVSIIIAEVFCIIQPDSDIFMIATDILSFVGIILSILCLIGLFYFKSKTKAIEPLLSTIT